MADYREVNRQWYSRFDERTMTIVVYEDDEAEFTAPARYEVCSTCDGKGSHVNPAIDSHGIGAEEWAEEWDDESREMYFNGGYDVPCNECHGRRVAPEPDWDRMTPEERAKVERAIEDHYAIEAEYAMERRFGA
jgi:hypothetical protein